MRLAIVAVAGAFYDSERTRKPLMVVGTMAASVRKRVDTGKVMIMPQLHTAIVTGRKTRCHGRKESR